MKFRLFRLAIVIAIAFAPSTSSAWHDHPYGWSQQWNQPGYNAWGSGWMGTQFMPPVMFYPPMTFYSPGVYYTPAYAPVVQPAPAPVCTQPAPAAPKAAPKVEQPLPPSTYFLVSTVKYCENDASGNESCRNVRLDPASITEDRELLPMVAHALDLEKGYQITASFLRSPDGNICALVRALPLTDALEPKVFIGNGDTTMDALRLFIESVEP
jgi:hypothetical protein